MSAGYGWKPGQMPPRVSVPEAAALVGREVHAVYRWIRAGKLAADPTPDGLEVQTADVLAVAAATRRGRPPGHKFENRVP